MTKLASDSISIFWLVSVAEETGLSLPLLETPKTGCVSLRPNYKPVLVHSKDSLGLMISAFW